MKITSIKAIQILDSRGNPTIETTIILNDGSIGMASVPSGASTGSHEAIELRDKNNEKFEGKGVTKAIKNIQEVIAPSLIGKTIEGLAEIDQIMIDFDGTKNKSYLGANAILSVSLACARALAGFQQKSLWKILRNYYFPDITPSFPRLMVNIINGGRHANWAFDIQEFMIIPKSNIPSVAIETAQEVFYALENIITKKGLSTLKGDEGGFAPSFTSNREPFETIQQAAKDSTHEQDIELGIDAAASEFYHNGRYELKKEEKKLNARELSAFYGKLITDYGLHSIEDPFAEDDWEAFVDFTEQYGKGIQIVGDDLFTTNPQRIQKGIETKAANAVLVKPNQIGTLLETVEAIKLTQKAGWKVAISQRSGETNDNFIADLAYACGADYLKAGSMSRSERLAKYNRLIEIEKNDVNIL